MATDPPNPTVAPTLRLLHVDDSDDDHILLVHCVETVAIPVDLRSATSAAGALRFLAQELPDLILLDIKMPGTSGLDLLAALKGDPRLSAVPVIMLSTSTSTKDVAEARRLGAHGYCVKPGSISDYKAFVSHLYEGWSQGQIPSDWPRDSSLT